LLGAECIISGISPAIAQTIVHLGIDLSSIRTKATLQDAMIYAMKQNKLSENVKLQTLFTNPDENED